MNRSAIVSGPEAEMLAVARALVTPAAYASIEPTLLGSTSLTKLGPRAMAVLKDTLAKGVVKMLARLGGARPRIRHGTGSTQPVRVFEVRRAPELAFGAYTFELLRWLTTTTLGSRPRTGESLPRFEVAAETLGDQLCAYLALRLVEGKGLERVIASSRGLRCGLAWLGHARLLSRFGGGLDAPTLAPLVETEDGRVVLECLGPDLARRWAAAAIWPEDTVLDADEAVRVVTQERVVLDALLDALDRARRWDLATFLIDAAARALPRGASPRDVAGRVAPRVRVEGATLRARSEARRRSGALFHALGRLGQRREALGLVRFVDEDYDAAQAMLASWEFFPREGFTRAAGVVSALGSLEELEPAPAP